MGTWAPRGLAAAAAQPPREAIASLARWGKPSINIMRNHLELYTSSYVCYVMLCYVMLCHAKLRQSWFSIGSPTTRVLS